MDTSALKNFAQESRRYLMDVVSKKIQYYLTTDNVEIRVKKHLVEELKKEIANSSKEQVIEKIAYTWFNRFCALRYMDVKQYSLVGVLTPMSESHTQPEILMEAKSGHIKDELGNSTSRDHVIGLLSGKVSSNDPQSEAYKLLVLMTCNYYHSIMPFLFEKIDDYTELLMPDDLLSEASIISKVREALNEENCKDVEVIGWLYQFYISEKKDEVINRRSMVKKEEIPAATQLFTPDWIVKFIVENTLGRYWLANRSSSNLRAKMEYYIDREFASEEISQDFSIENISLCDPACGSGHILVYAFELLYAMYEEEGYQVSTIPRLILEKNLFGVEIDSRAGSLASFSLIMKGREKHRRFFSTFSEPNVCILKNLKFDKNEIDIIEKRIQDLKLNTQLGELLEIFEHSDNFGSLIPVSSTYTESLKMIYESFKSSSDLFSQQIELKLFTLLNQSSYLGNTYNIVVANPPYMGQKGMNLELKDFIQKNFKIGKSDLFSAFILRNFNLTKANGYLGFVTPFVWMFISSFEELRSYILKNSTISSLVQLEYNAFAPACIPVCAFTLLKTLSKTYSGRFIKLSDFKGIDSQPLKTLEAIKNPNCSWSFNVSSNDFKALPGSPIAYWISDKFRNIFNNSTPLKEFAEPRKGMVTADNGRFIRYWFEVDFNKIGFDFSDREKARQSKRKWFPYMKGGAFRRWYGNNDCVVNWENDGHELLNMKSEGYKVGSTNHNLDYIFKPSITWTKITSSDSGFRYNESGYLFDDASGLCPAKNESDNFGVLAFLNSPITMFSLRALNPTLNLNPGNLADIPYLKINEAEDIGKKCVEIVKADWDSREISFAFQENPLVKLRNYPKPLREIYKLVRNEQGTAFEKLKELEEANNFLHLKKYGLDSESTHIVPDSLITLFSNPSYRYSGELTYDEKNSLLLVDTIKDLISFFVGCLFGRYSIELQGLLLASHSSATDMSSVFKEVKFQPDADNVLPILEGEWFLDDISLQFKKLLKFAFGEKYYEDNLSFIEEALNKSIEKYFSRDFYNDHIKQYSKRPIYWMFSSPKGTFNALIYMHRYTPDTVSIVLNSYLREFRTKLNSKRENLERVSVAEATSARDKTAALKEIEQLKKMIVELDEYEKDILYPLATQRLEIDLDDGVKANYPKFGKALKTIKGLDKDED